MATRPYKTTGCFRFFLFLLIFAPIAYLGAAYYNGQDGIGQIKNLWHKISAPFAGSQPKTDATSTEPSQSEATSTLQIELSELKASIDRKDKEINKLIDENLDLKLKLKECESKPNTNSTPIK
jgi:cell division protein FtsB